MNRDEHGKRRAGKIGASEAHTIMHGGSRAWDTLVQKLWADDGSKFAQPVGGARGFGLDSEGAGIAKFWDRHPEYSLSHVGWLEAVQDDLAGFVGCSPDQILLDMTDRPAAGLEVKSPTTLENMGAHRYADHEDQLQHSLLVTGLPLWYLVCHFGEDYAETPVEPDRAWQEAYLPKLRAFLKQYNEGVTVRRKLSLSDLMDD